MWAWGQIFWAGGNQWVKVVQTKVNKNEFKLLLLKSFVCTTFFLPTICPWISSVLLIEWYIFCKPCTDFSLVHVKFPGDVCLISFICYFSRFITRCNYNAPHHRCSKGNTPLSSWTGLCYVHVCTLYTCILFSFKGEGRTKKLST